MSSLHYAVGHVSRLLVVVLILLAGTTGVVAAQGTTNVSLSVEASPPWTEPVSLDVVPESTPGQLFSDGERYVLVLAESFEDAAQQRLDALTEIGAAGDSIESVDAGETDSLSYWLDALLVDGQPWGAFTIVRTQAETGIQVFTMYAAPIDGFADGLASAQESISVNDEPVFDGVGGEGLEELLISAAPAAGDEADETPGASDDEDSPAESTEEPAPDDEDKADDNDEDIPYADAGMVGPTQYVSPQFGVEIEWTSDWDLDETFGDAVISDRKLEQDTLFLLWNEEWEAWMIIFIFDPGSGATVAEVVEYSGSQSTAVEWFGEGAEVVMANASSGLGGVITLVDEGAPDLTLIYDEYRFGADGATMIEVRLISLNPDVTEAAIEAASADITVDGEPILVYYPAADVAEVHAG